MTTRAGGRGRFITLEGGEGGGKSTQVKLLLPWLKEKGIDVVATREPGGSPGAERVRELLVTGSVDRWTPLTELLLHYAARADHVLRTVEPALAAGKWVVSDRFFDSTLAYQGYGHGVSLEFVEKLRQQIIGEANKPDLTIILDLPAEEGLRRSHARPNSERRYESMPLEFHERLRHGFQEIAKREPERCAIVNAEQEVDAVQQAIRSLVVKKLGVAA
jgi:dTMP kinase